jgi:hypothetical protein
MMAGTIIISNGVGVALNSLDFGEFTDAIRLGWGGNPQEVLAKIYESLDEEGMSYIALDRCTAVEFRVFQRVIEKLCEDRSPRAHESPSKHLWDELVSALHADVRSNT